MKFNISYIESVTLSAQQSDHGVTAIFKLSVLMLYEAKYLILPNLL